MSMCRVRISARIAVVAVLFAALGAPVVAYAEEPAAPPPIATAVTVSAPAVIAARETTTVMAQVVDASGTPLPAAQLVAWTTANPPAVFLAGMTDEQGVWRFPVKPQSALSLRVAFSGDATYSASVSETFTVRPKVALTRPWTHDVIAYPGQRLPARGLLWPRHSTSSTATVIVCDRWNGSAWVPWRTYPATIRDTATMSRYDGVFRITTRGTWRVRMRHVDDHAFTYGPSTVVTVTDWRARYAKRRNHGYKSPSKMVAITIDDGPNKRTLEICSILERYDAKGTFFFTKHNLDHGYYGQAKKAYDRGHEIANHTKNHDVMNRSYASSYSTAWWGKRAVRRATGFDPVWVRAAGGAINSTGLRATWATDQLYAQWSLDSYDSHRMYTPPSTLYHTVVDHVRSGDVILIHQTHAESVKALPAICRELKRRGYKMVTLSELAARSKPR